MQNAVYFFLWIVLTINGLIVYIMVDFKHEQATWAIISLGPSLMVAIWGWDFYIIYVHTKVFKKSLKSLDETNNEGTLQKEES